MIASSRIVAALALACATGLHFGGIINMSPEFEAETEGSAGSQDLRLGTGFADLVAGTLSSEHPEVVAEALQPDAASPLRPKTISATEPDTTSPRQPDMTAAETTVDRLEPTPHAEPVEPQLADSPESPRITSARAQTLPARKVTEDTATPVKQAVKAITAKSTDATPKSAKSHAEVRKPEPTEVLSARDLEPDPPRKKPEQRKARPAPQGNADRNTTAGATAGTATAQAVTRGSGGAASETGNAAASNYPGKVMRHLSRVSRPRVRARGAAVVAFRVADNGDLSGLSLSNSSGSDALDRAAVGVVKGAAPFPAPPSGARRSFTIEIKGR